MQKRMNKFLDQYVGLDEKIARMEENVARMNVVIDRFEGESGIIGWKTFFKELKMGYKLH